MIHQLLFVVDGIITALHKPIYTANQAKAMDKKLVQLYVDWNQMYIFSRKEKFTESNLKTFKVNSIIKFSIHYKSITHAVYLL